MGRQRVLTFMPLEGAPAEATLSTVAEAVADGVLAGHAARRERAARAVCALCADSPRSVQPLARALAERWQEGADRRALARALATLAERDRRAVEVALGSAAVPAEIRRAVEDARPWALPGSTSGRGEGRRQNADGAGVAIERGGPDRTESTSGKG